MFSKIVRVYNILAGKPVTYDLPPEAKRPFEVVHSMSEDELFDWLAPALCDEPVALADAAE